MAKPTLPPAYYADEAGNRAFESIKGTVTQQFFDLWKREWPKRVRDKMIELDDIRLANNPGGSRRSYLRIDSKSKAAHFDLLTLLHALHDNRDLLPCISGRETEIDSLCRDILDYRNAHQHNRSPNFRHQLRPAIEQIKRFVALVEIVGGEEKGKPLKDYLNDFINEDVPEPATLDRNGSTEAAEQWKAIRDLQAALKEMQNQRITRIASTEPPEQPNESPGTNTQSRSPLSRRRTPIPPPGRGVVLFPKAAEGVDADEHGELAYFMSSIRPTDPDSSILASTIGFNQKILFTQIVEAARSDEPNPVHINLFTFTRVVPLNVAGRSWCIAAVLADKSARYGWSAIARDRPIIATGEIERLTNAIGKIQSFHQKLKLLEREASDSSIFVFPASNIDTPDQYDLVVMKRLKERGMLLVPIRDLADLDHLLEINNAEILADDSSTHTTPSPTFADDAIAKPKWLSTVKILVGACAAVSIFLLIGIFQIGSYMERNRLTPEQAQQIADLVSAQTNNQASAMSPQECSKLAAAARGVAAIDRKRLDPPAMQALTQASSCAQRIQASDTKLASLVDAGQRVTSVGVDFDGCSTLVTAVAALDPFDKDRLGELHKRAASITEACRPVLHDSDRRLAEVSRRAAAVSLGSADLMACDALVTAGHQLSQPDLQRIRAKPGDESDKLEACAVRLQASDNRIAALSNAADVFDPADPDSVAALSAARSKMESADIARLDPKTRDKIQNASTRAAALLRDSNSRITAFVASFKEWQRNPSSANAVNFERSAQITDFDRKRMTSADSRDAETVLSKMREIRKAQADRWSRVRAITASADRQTAADYFRPLTEAVGALTQADKETATADQREILDRATVLLNSASGRSGDFATIPSRR